jgi:hypothetical protein
VQVDTGSSDLAVYSSNCTTVPAGDPTYDPWASSTSSVIDCGVSPLACACGGSGSGSGSSSASNAGSSSGADAVNSNSSQCSYTLRYLDQSGFTALLFNDTVTLPGTGNSLETFAYIGAISKATAGFESAPVSGVSLPHRPCRCLMVSTRFLATVRADCRFRVLCSVANPSANV